MKNLVKIIAGMLLVILVSACSEKGAKDVSSSAPAETAKEFVARANAELKERSNEVGALEETSLARSSRISRVRSQ